MTDERLDQILKQALAPEISENDIRVKKRVRAKKMNKIVKRSIGVAACAALIATVGVGANYRNIIGTGRDNVADNRNPFVITAYAAELEGGKAVPVILGEKQSWAICGGEDGETINYVILTDFRCEGDDIESITYSINKGAFNISEMADDSIITDAAEYEGEMNSGSIGDIEDEEGNIISESRFLKEYTVSYDAQTNDATTISICGEKTMPGAFDIIWGETESNYEEVAKVYDELLDGVEITCTVHFTDGSSANQVITAGGQVMTYAEAGMCEEGETFDTGEDWETKDAFFSFKLKEN
ncbi:MAG: hypothetical protein ACI4ES_08965 [Roseburia sp.]